VGGGGGGEKKARGGGGEEEGRGHKRGGTPKGHVPPRVLIKPTGEGRKKIKEKARGGAREKT